MANRNNDRAPGRLQVMYRSPSALLVAYSVNLSRGGMFIECEDELPPEGAELDLDITLPDQEIVSLQSVVTWRREMADETGSRGVGVEFDSFPHRLGQIVDELVLKYSGITILVQCADFRDRKTLVRMLKAIIGTADIVLADDETIACALLGVETDLLVVDVDEGEPGALIALATARENQIPTIALSQTTRTILSTAADETLPNPPTSALLRKTVLQLLARPIRG